MQTPVIRNTIVYHKDDPNQLQARVTRVSPFGHIAWTDRPIWGHDIHPTEDLLVVSMVERTNTPRVPAEQGNG